MGKGEEGEAYGDLLLQAQGQEGRAIHYLQRVPAESLLQLSAGCQGKDGGEEVPRSVA